MAKEMLKQVRTVYFQTCFIREINRLLSLNSLFLIFWYFPLNLILAALTTKCREYCSRDCEACWHGYPMLVWSSQPVGELWCIHIWWLCATLHYSHINFLFSPQMVITTEKIKCSVGDELGDATYSGRDHENFRGGDTPRIWSWIFMGVGICREWDDVEYPRNRKNIGHVWQKARDSVTWSARSKHIV